MAIMTLVACLQATTHTRTHMCKANTYHTPPVHPHTHPTCSKLVAVNEAADACVLCKPTAPQWTPDTAWTTPHWDNLHCGMPGGWRQTSGKYATVVLWKHWYLLVPIHSHSCPALWSRTRIYSTVIAIMRENTFVWRWDLHCVWVTTWVIDRNPWCGVCTIGTVNTGGLVRVEQRSHIDLPY